MSTGPPLAAPTPADCAAIRLYMALETADGSFGRHRISWPYTCRLSSWWASAKPSSSRSSVAQDPEFKKALGLMKSRGLANVEKAVTLLRQVHHRDDSVQVGPASLGTHSLMILTERLLTAIICFRVGETGACRCSQHGDAHQDECELPGA
eukprot:scaffold187978_cov33-Tisochrysis_lutea.AAC.2